MDGQEPAIVESVGESCGVGGSFEMIAVLRRALSSHEKSHIVIEFFFELRGAPGN